MYTAAVLLAQQTSMAIFELLQEIIAPVAKQLPWMWYASIWFLSVVISLEQPCGSLVARNSNLESTWAWCDYVVDSLQTWFEFWSRFMHSTFNAFYAGNNMFTLILGKPWSLEMPPSPAPGRRVGPAPSWCVLLLSSLLVLEYFSAQKKNISLAVIASDQWTILRKRRLNIEYIGTLHYVWAIEKQKTQVQKVVRSK